MSESAGIFLFIVSILFVVVVHEAGHFTLAKVFGIKVEEFFVGFGPRLWSFKRGETEYGVKALPLGGYVRIAGMNPYQETPPEDMSRTYGAKPIWQRALVIGAGPVTHFVMAILLFAIFFVAIGVQSGFVPAISAVEPTLNGQPSPAAVAGLQAGDRIVALDGIQIAPSDDPDISGQQFIDYTRAHVGQAIQITVSRDGKLITASAAPVLADVEGKQVGRLGVILGSVSTVRERTDPFTAIGRGANQTVVLVKAIVVRLGDVFGPSGLKRIGQLLTGSERRVDDVTSVVGGARLAGEAAKAGAWDALFELLVVFNVFVGILNLVPLPPLDGGHLAVLVYEKVRRKKPDIRKLVPLTVVVAGFLVLFALAVAYIDVTNPLPSPFR
jgi:membrane-associated protease RseP (regulator of RpoE activity)